MYVWPASEFTVEELNSLVHRIRPTMSGAGLEEVQFVVRQRGATGELAEVAVRITADAGRTVRLHVGPPPTEPVRPLDDYRQKVLRAARRGTVYPYELTGLLAGPDGRFTEHDLDESGALVPVDRPKGKNTAAIVAGVVSTPTERHPEGVTRVVLLGDPTKSLGALSEPECARVIAALDLAERLRRAGRVVRAVVGRADLDDLRHREHGLGGRRAQADRRVHPGRRRDQRRGRRDQRRRPAVLERRGHDAHAHQGHPGDDAGLGDGAHRQAGARLLRRGVGRGQLRHRRLRPGDGAQRPGAVLGAEPAPPPATS